MNLNNRGWGLRVMLALCSIIILALFVSYSIYQNIKEIIPDNNQITAPQEQTPSINLNYEKLEKDLIEAGYQYQQDKYPNLGADDGITITYKKLVELNYIKETKDCSGYVEIQNIDNNIEKKSYIKCNNYTTKGYISELDYNN